MVKSVVQPYLMTQDFKNLFPPFNLRCIVLFYVVVTVAFEIIDFLLTISITFYNLEISDGREI